VDNDAWRYRRFHAQEVTDQPTRALELALPHVVAQGEPDARTPSFAAQGEEKLAAHRETRHSRESDLGASAREGPGARAALDHGLAHRAVRARGNPLEAPAGLGRVDDSRRAVDLDRNPAAAFGVDEGKKEASGELLAGS
jgi:hypothetical protein